MVVDIDGRRLELVQGDITEQATDAIVNAANSRLQLGAGVAGAIRAKGGPSIQEECDRIGGTPVGTAAITGGGELKARYVIHAVGPRMGEGDEETKLAGAVRGSLDIAASHQLQSISLPAISTGIFGFPLQRAAEIIIDEAITFLKRPSSLETIRVCLFSDEDYRCFSDILKQRQQAC